MKGIHDRCEQRMGIVGEEVDVVGKEKLGTLKWDWEGE